MLNHTIRRLRCAAIAVALLVPAHSAIAKPITLDTVVTDLGNGFFEYSYTLKNPKRSLDSIFDVGLFFDGSAFNVLAPKGWDSISGLGFIDWFDLGPEYDLLAGHSLEGFSFQSALGPGLIKFQATNADPLTGEPTFVFEGTTTGPLDVPEPATLWLVGVAAITGLSTMRKRLRRPM